MRQYYTNLEEKAKNKLLFSILHKVSYNQAIIFTSKVDRAKFLCKLMCEMDFPAITIHSEMNQKSRIEHYDRFKKGEKRILVATNLVARGIDIERVNLVVNFDMPEDSNTYLHRVGRAGRYNTKGIAISMITSEEDKKVLEEIQSRFELEVEQLPSNVEECSFN